MTDPSYIKLEKLEIINRLCSSANVEAILNELQYYANDIDPEFARKQFELWAKWP